MNFIAPPPGDYDPENSQVFLKGTAVALEAENAYKIGSETRKALQKGAIKRGFVIGESLTCSYYFDTRNLDLFRHGLTLRIRPGSVENIVDPVTNTTRVHQVFLQKFALKRRNHEFEAAAKEFFAHQAAALNSENIHIRDEAEGEHEAPVAAGELRFHDLPQQPLLGHAVSISDVIGKIMTESSLFSISQPQDLVLVPWVATFVKRKRADFYLASGINYNFRDRWPASELTQAMQETGKWLKIEAALHDACDMRACPRDRTIYEMMAMPSCKMTFLGHHSLFEYEIKEFGERLVDAEAFKIYKNFGAAMKAYAQDHGENLEPTRSKATNALALHPACAQGKKLHNAFTKGLKHAP